jgi:hypothetical protein
MSQGFAAKLGALTLGEIGKAAVVGGIIVFVVGAATSIFAIVGYAVIMFGNHGQWVASLSCFAIEAIMLCALCGTIIRDKEDRG